MGTAREYFTATLLPTGKVLVAGGFDQNLNSLASAELYDPAAPGWTPTGSLNVARQNHTATLLLDGRVLVGGGTAMGGATLATTELYDPATRQWSVTAALSNARYQHTATLLPNGRVLFAHGANSSTAMAAPEFYDVNLGFSTVWQPQITSLTSPLNLGDPLTIAGSKFRGLSEGSGGNSYQDSAADYPVVQLRAIESGQTTFLLTTNWSTNSYVSVPVTGFAPGWALATVFVNGIPGPSSIFLVTATPSTVILQSPIRLGNGSVQFSFSSTPGATFTALAATGLSTPASTWTPLGGVTEITGGQYQFTDPQATNYPKRFYRVRSP